MREVSSQTVAGVASQKTLAILHPDNAGALYFERETINTGVGAGTVQNRHYLSAEKGAFLLITSTGSLQANPTATTLASTEQRYWHKDHLGSIVASTKATVSGTATTTTTATVIERLAYEPFGKRRFITGQADPTGTIEAQSTTRGFTGHEHLDGLDFIHMNARVYDPDIGRFLSPDPTVPDGHNPQSFNRYAYAMNNPLNLVDPDGFEPRAADGSFANGGYRGANSGPSGGPNTGSNGTAVAGNAIGANQPSKPDAAPIPGFTGLVPAADKPKTGFETTLDWYDNKIANPMIGAVPIVGAAFKAPSALARGFTLAAKVEITADKFSQPFKGGAYAKLEALVDRHRHHMPANSTTPLSTAKGPAIQMEINDHKKTSSFANSAISAAYRADIKGLIDAGKMRDAMAKEINDVRSIVGDKYNSAIKEMLDYSKSIGILNK
jgi:RHS repeat-associated protein